MAKDTGNYNGHDYLKTNPPQIEVNLTQQSNMDNPNQKRRRNPEEDAQLINYTIYFPKRNKNQVTY